jgi:hypothetical protein
MIYKTSVNGETREMTPSEATQYEIMLGEIAVLQIAENEKIANLTSARIKLAALGLTEKEIAALIG